MISFQVAYVDDWERLAWAIQRCFSIAQSFCLSSEEASTAHIRRVEQQLQNGHLIDSSVHPELRGNLKLLLAYVPVASTLGQTIQLLLL